MPRPSGICTKITPAVNASVRKMLSRNSSSANRSMKFRKPMKSLVS